MTAHVVAINTEPASFTGIPERFYGTNTDPQGHEIRFTNYFMTVDGKPRFMVMGEFEFSRVEAWQWEDELIKLKMMGVNIISFYVYWIHHEEKRGQWDFTGRRDLRRFVQLCAKHGLWCVARIGPFVHSETRNGGLPDWLYGQPYEVRENDPEFLKVVDDYYAHVGRQLRGLMYRDGGPIIATQLDNEYEHSSAPWECTTGVANEWVNTGSSGVAYIDALKKLALKHGFDTPFYTATAWGDAVTGDSAVPLWGGYPYRPWLFYGPDSGEHPATLEYQYQNFHSSADMAASMYDMFDTNYKPEDYPYACCEMGGGMFCSYNYRFVLPMKSVDAMANIKTASGCNFLGYYIIKGGTNPKRDGGFMNEGQCPKIQYDFQAPLGEFAQTRESYDRLKALHLFARTFENELTPMLPTLPAGQNRIAPKDTEPLRWSVRARGHSGFVFIDNFQDHVNMPARSGETIRVEFSDGAPAIDFENIGIAADENCILPFNMDMGGIRLVKATVQPVTRIATVGGGVAYVFLKPEGMPSPEFVFAPGCVTSQGGETYHCDPSAGIERFSVTGGGTCAGVGGGAGGVGRGAVGGASSVGASDAGGCGRVTVIVLDRAHADKLFVVDRPDGTQMLVIAPGAVIPDENGLRLETTELSAEVLTWPADALAGSGTEPEHIEDSGFGVYPFGVRGKGAADAAFDVAAVSGIVSGAASGAETDSFSVTGAESAAGVTSGNADVPFGTAGIAGTKSGIAAASVAGGVVGTASSTGPTGTADVVSGVAGAADATGLVGADSGSAGSHGSAFGSADVTFGVVGSAGSAGPADTTGTSFGPTGPTGTADVVFPSAIGAMGTADVPAPIDTHVELVRHSKTRWTVSVSPSLVQAIEDGRIKNAWLDVDYIGDIGQAFFDGDMIHDNFANGAVWQIGLHEFTRQLAAGPLTLYITPLKEGVTVDVNSPMAARSETAEKETSEILSVGVTPVYEYVLKQWR